MKVEGCAEMKSLLTRMMGVLLAGVVITHFAGCGGESSNDPPGPDVVVILIDTLRPDRLGFLGGPRKTAPLLSDLSRSSTVFRSAFSTSTWTAPSTASLFTSLYPPQHGVVMGLFAHRDEAQREVRKTGKAVIPLNRLPLTVPTLAELFQNSGYRTFGVTANANIGEELGFHRGFNFFERLHGMNRFDSGVAVDIEKQVLSWEKELDCDEPSFLYLHFNDVHAPYHKRKPWYVSRSGGIEDKKAAYDSEIGYLDDVLGRLCDRLKWRENAIIAVVSDHGEEFMDHGRIGHPATLYRELLQILMMVRLPGGSAAQEVVERVSILDLYPTLADLAGIPPHKSWEGRSLASIVKATGNRVQLEEALRSRPLFGHRKKYGADPFELWAVMHEDWKLIEQRENTELYHVIRDPGERRGDGGDAGVRERLMDQLRAFRERAKPVGGEQIEVELTKDDLDALERLGYVEGDEKE